MTNVPYYVKVIGKQNVDNGEKWDHMNGEVKEYIHHQVRHIPAALNKINYELISVDERPESIKLSNQEIDMIAEYEHKRISLEKKDSWMEIWNRI